MSQLWRNKGARFQREDGTLVQRFETFEAEADHPDVFRRRGKLERVAEGSIGDVSEDWKPGYPGVDFGSDRAYEIARDNELSPSAFLGQTGSGSDGAFLVSDVEGLLEERDDGEEA